MEEERKNISELESIAEKVNDENSESTTLNYAKISKKSNWKKYALYGAIGVVAAAATAAALIVYANRTLLWGSFSFKFDF